ncbi:hypothetical protein G7Y89_g14265 [Cudoniella acicularis]|uniref:Uncharacterized protein n=1 Tax=Cudoniella acicularis TaxID=354080 RepID=A0A8H4R6S7_9HELO|nr:hypothetical protein G7Y89_g14265 [Cudoniella acicularis]
MWMSEFDPMANARRLSKNITGRSHRALWSVGTETKVCSESWDTSQPKKVAGYAARARITETVMDFNKEWTTASDPGRMAMLDRFRPCLDSLPFLPLNSKMHSYKSLSLASQADPEDEKFSDELEGSVRQIANRKPYWSHAFKWLPWSLHLAVFVLYATLLARMKIWPESKTQSTLYNGAIPMEYTTVDYLEPSQYAGRPTAKKEAQWDSLLSVGFVSITEDEKSGLLHETATDRHNPDNYVVELDVFHQLHCLQALRKQVWYPVFIDIKNDPETVWEAHLDHCVDYLRHSLMCNAALTPTTFYWDEEKRGYHPTEAMPHTCVVFDNIWEWAASRNTTGDGVEFVGALPNL